jgi:hypothetical protein
LSNTKNIRMKVVPLGLICLIYSFSTSIASAVTIGELAQKNNELQALEIDLAIAKKKSDLAPYAAPKTALTVKIQKKSETADIDGLLMTEIFGDTSNPTIEFSQNGTQLIRRRGDTIGDWTIQSVHNKQATLVKARKSGKGSHSKTIYLSAKASPATYGQIEARNSVSTSPLPLPMPMPVFPQPH